MPSIRKPNLASKKSAVRPSAYCGLVVVNKPSGISSAQLVHKLRKLLSEPRAGHTGTLDPLATGVLPICFGPATKLAQFLSAEDKRYWARLHLGVTTTTLDRMGEVTDTADASSVSAIRDPDIERVLAGFVGDQLQTPPMFSAIKVRGKRLYERAMAGEELDREPRRITVYSIRMVARLASMVDMEVHCSKGTYIRSLVDDIGTKLGVGAHLSELSRTASGRYTIAEALPESRWDASNIAAAMIPMEQMTDLPISVVDPIVIERIRCGEPMPPSLVGVANDEQGRVLLRSMDTENAKGRILAVVYVSGGLVRYDRVFR
jgi:tRNA pseudouridine55 synthase